MDPVVDFELEIRSSGDDKNPVYTVAARCELAGEGDAERGPLRLSRDDLEAIHRGAHLVSESAVLRDLRASERSQTPSPTPREIGSSLFDTFFRGHVGDLFFESLAIARERHRILQIKVRLDPNDPQFPPLNLFPWELLYDSRHYRFLALSETTSVVRHLRVQSPYERVPPPSRLRVLLAVSNPSDTEPLAVEEEAQRIRELAQCDRRLRIEVLHRASLAGIVETLTSARDRRRPFRVLHFLGHGGLSLATDQGLLYLTATAGDSEEVPAEVLAQALSDRLGLELVFLNACLTTRSGRELDPREASRLFAGLASVASALVSVGIPRVVAMQQPITDVAALELSATFYREALAGSTVATAVREARKRLVFRESTRAEWSVPVLFQRVPDAAVHRPPSPWPMRAGLAAFLLAAVLTWGLWPAPLGPCEQRMSEVLRQKVSQAAALAREDERDRARALLEEALEQAPDLAVAHASMAFLEDREGAPERAADHYRAAVAARPYCALHRYHLGAFYEQNGRDTEAIPELLRAVELDPEHTRSYNELGLAYLDLQHPEEASRWLKAGLRRVRSGADRQDEILLLKNLGHALVAEGRPHEALAPLRKALETAALDDWTLRDEIVMWMARAEVEKGAPVSACARLSGQFRDRGRPPVSPWELEGAELASELDCPWEPNLGASGEGGSQG